MNLCLNHKFVIILFHRKPIPSVGIILLVLCFMIGCHRRADHGEGLKTPATHGAMPVAEFTRQYADLGTISQGEKTGIDFVYVNKGDADLIVLSCHSSCGCTVPSFSTKPLSPGDSASIRLIFDSAGTHGVQNKSAHVVTNARNAETDLIISALVVENNN